MDAQHVVLFILLLYTGPIDLSDDLHVPYIFTCNYNYGSLPKSHHHKFLGTRILYYGNTSDTVFLDFAKAFDVMPMIFYCISYSINTMLLAMFGSG